jgi:hypothetical protein
LDDIGAGEWHMPCFGDRLPRTGRL